MLFLLSVMGVLIAITLIFENPLDRWHAEEKVKEEAKVAKQVALYHTKLDFIWSKGGFDKVMLADFKIKNDNEFPIKDVTITCNHAAPSGTKLGSNTQTIYEVVKAKSTKRINNFNMGFIHSQTGGSRCEVTDLVLGDTSPSN
jgi:hypothetical protein